MQSRNRSHGGDRSYGTYVTLAVALVVGSTMLVGTAAAQQIGQPPANDATWDETSEQNAEALVKCASPATPRGKSTGTVADVALTSYCLVSEGDFNGNGVTDINDATNFIQQHPELAREGIDDLANLDTDGDGQNDLDEIADTLSGRP